MARLFGTDGVRGIANRDITADLALDLAIAAASVLSERGELEGHRPIAVVGRDTRISGQFLSASVAAGLASTGMDVLDAGVIPTPAIAHLVAALGADLGVVISASHNPMPDNGIKFFSRGGHKLDDSVEERIEERMGDVGDRPVGANVGTISARPDLVDVYVAHVVSAARAFGGNASPLEGLHVVADAAHGAASTAAAAALGMAGARVDVINAAPTGLNINDGVGSTHLDVLASAVVAAGADVGVAFDGDADRCLAIDHTGAVVDGDQIMGVLALQMKERGTLYRNTLVATVMSNLGLHVAMRAAGIDIVETAVGDRYVLEAMREAGYSLGGEQSGHIIVADHGTTGDGLLTALFLGATVAASGQRLRDLCAPIQRLPQALINVPEVDKSRVFTDEVLQEAVAAARAELGAEGRVLLRPSGTEALVRVMVEAQSEAQSTAVASSLASVVATRLGRA